MSHNPRQAPSVLYFDRLLAHNKWEVEKISSNITQEVVSDAVKEFDHLEDEQKITLILGVSYSQNDVLNKKLVSNLLEAAIRDQNPWVHFAGKVLETKLNARGKSSSSSCVDEIKEACDIISGLLCNHEIPQLSVDEVDIDKRRRDCSFYMGAFSKGVTLDKHSLQSRSFVLKQEYLDNFERKRNSLLIPRRQLPDRTPNSVSISNQTYPNGSGNCENESKPCHHHESSLLPNKLDILQVKTKIQSASTPIKKIKILNIDDQPLLNQSKKRKVSDPAEAPTPVEKQKKSRKKPGNHAAENTTLGDSHLKKTATCEPKSGSANGARGEESASSSVESSVKKNIIRTMKQPVQQVLPVQQLQYLQTDKAFTEKNLQCIQRQFAQQFLNTKAATTAIPLAPAPALASVHPISGSDHIRLPSQQQVVMLSLRDRNELPAAANMSSVAPSTPSQPPTTAAPSLPNLHNNNPPSSQPSSYLNLLREIFRNANKITQEDKERIVNFLSSNTLSTPIIGSNPIITVKLSEHQEQEVNSETGKPGTILVERLFEMNYSTRCWRHVKQKRRLEAIPPYL